jgi:pimeloyl-ACP methyl ester carboxylesterase
VSIYRSEHGRDLVTAWCRRRLDAWPVEHVRNVLPTTLGPTHVVTAGTGGPAVLVLPGTICNAATSTALATHLAAHRRTIVVDLPGQPGLSAGARLGRDRITRYGAWLDELISQVSDAPVHLLGHSLGAAVALAATPSDRVAGLALVDPAGLAPVRVTVALLAATVPWAVRANPRRSGRMLAYMTAPAAEPPGHLVDWLTLVARNTRTSGAPGPLPAALLDRWRATPRVVATGQHDRFFPPSRLGPAARSGLGSDTVIIPGAGHISPEERPAEVAALLSALPLDR